MATILLVEDAPDIGAYEAVILEAEGHRVFRCNGAPTPLACCPMIRDGRCALPENADVIVFACSLMRPARHRSYRGVDLLRGYRAHARYGRLPMLVVWAGARPAVGGPGPIRFIEKFSPPHMVIDAVHKLIETTDTRKKVDAR